MHLVLSYTILVCVLFVVFVYLCHFLKFTEYNEYGKLCNLPEYMHVDII